ncbi:regulatory protein SUAPRGA1 [Talaromyces stipitatus ATCC 10500]|uniref:Regulatory protein SUAPRGA1 n=1 Tax=Talaromyces stipitatus (strain ATCC 10500 / CBS 375.48 / QM 6759 / NRRL 1006) TaxID=441959 RepID=B8MTL6_TALSN|nr:regulatory protein SUAPRGA1 [Talaromyces stipitatus ATCC 10500]EED12422.1 regulatory protein SUAPRGA1 [Talaromyces stipitatus ATCC 10500]
MLSLRAFTRSAPRAFARSYSVAARPSTIRLATAIQRPSLLQKSFVRCQYPSFSTARILREPAGEVDLELSGKLEEELSHEQSSGELEESAAAIKSFLENSSWTVKDVAGEQEVVLTRKFGNEKIRATFTVSDLQNVAEDEFDSLAESDYENVNQAAPGEPISTRPEDRIAPSDREFDEDAIPGFPARVNIAIEKPGNGALLIQTTASDGIFEIHEVSHFANADLAEAETAEKDWLRQSLYSGPAYGNLDEELQALFDRYLEERGFNAELANIIPEYITVKEQKEYTRWLETVKKFVSA